MLAVGCGCVWLGWMLVVGSWLLVLVGCGVSWRLMWAGCLLLLVVVCCWLLLVVVECWLSLVGFGFVGWWWS